MKVFPTLLVLLLTSELCADPSIINHRFLGSAQNDYIHDLYQANNSDFILVGRQYLQAQNAFSWIMRVNSIGELLWQVTEDRENDGVNEWLNSAIETDNGDIVAGGEIWNSSGFIACRVSGNNGRTIWDRRYRDDDEGACTSVIESKSGILLLAGSIEVENIKRGYIAFVDDNGEIQEERIYDADICSFIRVILEAPEVGYFAGGFNRSNNAVFLKIDSNGDLIDSWAYPTNGATTSLLSMVSNGDYYIVLKGVMYSMENQELHMVSITREGEYRVLHRFSNMLLRQPGLAKYPNGGYAVVATGYPEYPIIYRLNGHGELSWEFTPGYLFSRNNGGGFTACVMKTNAGLVIAGDGAGPHGRRDGVWLQLEPELAPPEILFIRPPPPEVSLLVGERLLFRVRAEDRQGDSIRFSFHIDDQQVSDSNAVVLGWDEFGEHTVRCTVSDAELSQVVTWHVTVTDLYVSAFTPDTLDLAVRRGTSVDFSLDTIRYTDGAEPEILWTKTNLSNGQVEETGRDAGVTIDFPWSGEYSVEGRVSRGESSDAVTWHVDVRGAIWAYVPVDDSLEVLPDSFVHFEVVPSAPEDENLQVSWLVDGELVREGELALDWVFGEADSTVDNCRRYLVQCVVADSVEVDTVWWVVTVSNLSTPCESAVAALPVTALLEVSPNPFNSTLTIRFQSVESVQSVVNLSIYDISGRDVANLLGSTGVSAGQGFHPVSAGRGFHPATKGGATERQITWDASASPAGVYFVRLQADGKASTKKVVLMR